MEKALERATASFNDRLLAQAARTAQNAWWAAEYEIRLFQPARELESGADLTQEQKDELQKLLSALDTFLTLDTHYDLDPGDHTEQPGTFRGDLKGHVDAIYAFVRKVKPDFELDSPAPVTPPARLRTKGLLPDLTGLAEAVRDIPPPTIKVAAPTWWFWAEGHGHCLQRRDVPACRHRTGSFRLEQLHRQSNLRLLRELPGPVPVGIWCRSGERDGHQNGHPLGAADSRGELNW